MSQRWLAAGERVVGAIAVEATTVEEKSALTVDRYDSTDHCRGSDLFDWERRWFAARDASYDAVILGWESLSHVVDREMQADLFKCLDRICPDGPILASFWQRSGEAPAGVGKAERIGRSIGRTLMRLRGSRAATTDQVVFTTHAGFAYVFAEEEPRLLAERVGRTIASEANDEFPHVTFLKRG